MSECVVEEDMFSSKPSKYIPALQSSCRHAEFRWCCESNLTINKKQKFSKMLTTFNPSYSKITISIFAGLSCTRGNILEELGAPQLVRGISLLFNFDFDNGMAIMISNMILISNMITNVTSTMTPHNIQFPSPWQYDTFPKTIVITCKGPQSLNIYLTLTMTSVSKGCTSLLKLQFLNIVQNAFDPSPSFW